VAGLQADENKIAKLRGQVNEVKDIMKDNIEKVIERGEKAQDLSDRTGLIFHHFNHKNPALYTRSRPLKISTTTPL
jgi:hypothetical protein